MLVMAHRGYSGRYPENTMLAFRKAVEAGCDGIELDVHETSDGHLVIIHDDFVDRTTDGSGLVCRHTLSELKKLNAAKLYEGVCAPEEIPAFDEYCRWLAGQDIFTNIEIKTDNYYYPAIEQKIWDVICEYGCEKKVMFSSFNHISLQVIKRIAPDVPVGALTLSDGGVHGFAGDYCRQCGFEYWHPKYDVLDDDNVRNCRENGVGINFWTVNGLDFAEKLEEWGCSGIITNYPRIPYEWQRNKRQ